MELSKRSNDLNRKATEFVPSSPDPKASATGSEPTPLGSPSSLRDGAIVMQLKYYFSEANLCRGIFLRSQMDKEGFVPLSTILTFPKIAKFGESMPLELEDLVRVANESAKLEVIEEKVPVLDPEIRKALGWNEANAQIADSLGVANKSASS